MLWSKAEAMAGRPLGKLVAGTRTILKGSPGVRELVCSSKVFWRCVGLLSSRHIPGVRRMGTALCGVVWNEAYRAAMGGDEAGLRIWLEVIEGPAFPLRDLDLFMRLLRRVEHQGNAAITSMTVRSMLVELVKQKDRVDVLSFLAEAETAIALLPEDVRATHDGALRWFQIQPGLVGAFADIEARVRAIADEPEAWHVRELVPAYSYAKRYPWRAGDQDIIEQGTGVAIAPAVSVAFVGPATVYGSGLVLQGTDDRTLIDYEAGVDLRSPYCAGHRHYVRARLSNRRVHLHRPPEKRGTVEKGVLLGGRASVNYFHWMIEYLPRVIPLLDDPDLSDREFLVRLPLAVTQIEALKAAAGVDVPIRAWNDSFGLDVDNLAVVSGPAIVHDDPGIPSEDVLECNLELIHQMAKRIVDNLGLAEVRGDRRIMLMRSGIRDIVNSKAVIKLLKTYGFEAVSPQGLTFKEQVKLFREAKVIVGPSGAAFTNIIFSRPGTSALILNAERHARNSVFSQLADSAGARLAQVPGREDVPLKQDLFVPSLEDAVHRNYRIALPRLRRAVEWALE